MSHGAPEALPRQDVEVVDQPEEAIRELRLAPIVGFLVAWLGIPWIVVGAWVQPLVPGGWWLVALGLVLCVLPVRTLVRGIRNRTYPSAVTRLLVLRPFWYAMAFLPLLAVVTLLGGLVGLPFGDAGSAGRWALGAMGRSAVFALFGAAFDGVRVVQISDLHVGPHTARSFLDRVVRAVRDQQPDLLVVSGDQVDDFARDVELFNRAFGDLEAPLGVFAVAGNHDVYAGWQAVHHGLVDAGFTVLVNEAVPVESRRARRPADLDRRHRRPGRPWLVRRRRPHRRSRRRADPGRRPARASRSWRSPTTRPSGPPSPSAASTSP